VIKIFLLIKKKKRENSSGKKQTVKADYAPERFHAKHAIRKLASSWANNFGFSTVDHGRSRKTFSL
jgi:hypothetical protein